MKTYDFNKGDYQSISDIQSGFEKLFSEDLEVSTEVTIITNTISISTEALDKVNSLICLMQEAGYKLERKIEYEADEDLEASTTLIFKF